MNKAKARIRRARQTRIRIALQRATRLTVGRSNSHIYAQIIAPSGEAFDRDGRRARAGRANERGDGVRIAVRCIDVQHAVAVVAENYFLGKAPAARVVQAHA